MPTGFRKSVSTLQFELANEAKVPNIIQWREAAGCRIEDAPNDEHRDLLKHESVWTLNESQLVSEIIRAVKSRNISITSSSRTSAPVFVHSDLCDRLLAQSVTQCLNTKGLTAELLPEQGNVRKFLEEKLLLCNAALLVHGKSDWAWVNEHVTHFAMNRVRRLSSKPPRTPAMVGLLEAGRTNGYTLDADLPELASYEMKGDMDETSLNAVIDRFVAQLSQRSHGQAAF